jgi:hypothetical protein
MSKNIQVNLSRKRLKKRIFNPYHEKFRLYDFNAIYQIHFWMKMTAKL